MNNFSEIIMLKYPYNGETKSGTIRLNFRLKSEEPGREYISIEYGDQDIQSYVEGNPSVLTQVESLRDRWKP